MLKKTDYKLLNEQRLELLKLIWNDPNSNLYGLADWLGDVCYENGIDTCEDK